MKPKLFTSVAALLLTLSSLAGNFNLPDDSVKVQLVKDWERARAYTKEYLDAMPADKYTWRPVDSIRSFAEQMIHLANGNVGLVSNGTGKERIFVGREKSQTAQNKDSVVHYVIASYDYCIDAIRNMDASKLGEIVKRGNLSESKLAWILKGFEHQGHHRGQCTIYIRMQGIRPPNERLF